MTYEESLKILKLHRHSFNNDVQKEACGMWEEAIVKQIPQNVLDQSEKTESGTVIYSQYVCPCCGYVFDVWDTYWSTYCQSCGQKLEWHENVDESGTEN